MTNEEREDRILKKLDSVEAALNSQLLAVREEIAALNQKQRVLSSGQNELLERQKKMTDRQNQLDKIAQEHSDEINRLTKLVDDLAKDRGNVVWESKNGAKLGLKREPVYDLFDSLGIPRNYALTLLDAGRKLCVECSSKSFNHSKNVRIKGGPVTRAIVILTE